jgi:hypothetical protein
MLFTTPPAFLRPLALAALVALGACSSDKKDDPAPTNPSTNPTNGFSWTADGTNYTSTTAVKSVAGGGMALLGQYKASNNDTYNVSINVSAMPGTYTIGGGSNDALLSYDHTIGGTSTSYVASGTSGSGTVTVTSVTASEIVGTFSFTGETMTMPKTSKTITNGKFNLKR